MRNFASHFTLLISITGQNCKSIIYLDLEKYNLITSQIKLLLHLEKIKFTSFDFAVKALLIST